MGAVDKDNSHMPYLGDRFLSGSSFCFFYCEPSMILGAVGFKLVGWT